MSRKAWDHNEDHRPVAGTVTRLALKGAQAERVAVFIDGERAFDISAILAQEAGLRKDDVLSEEQVRDLLLSDEPYRAREMALKTLARRDLLSAELGSRLRDFGVHEGEIAALMRWLEDRGYVDDRRYAATFVATRSRAGWGRRRTVGELVRKGLDRSVADDVWQQWASEGSEAVQRRDLVALVSRRFGVQLKAEPAMAKRRIGGFLARRGHDWEMIAAVLKEIGQGEDAPADDL